MVFLPLPENPAPGGSDSSAAERPQFGLAFELEALRGLVDPAILEAAADRARKLDVGGDTVLKAGRVLSSDQIALALAAKLGVAFDAFEDDRPASVPTLGAALTGVLRLRGSGANSEFMIAPRGTNIRALASAIGKNPRLRKAVRLTSPERMDAYIRRCGAAEVAHEAVNGLLERHPDLSAAPRAGHGLRTPAIMLVLIAILAGCLFPQGSLAIVEAVFGLVFLSWVGLRLHACRMAPATRLAFNLPERALPTYSVIVALYREAGVARQLVSALSRIDYPPEKLDIKLVCEPDDRATIAALKSLDLDSRFEILVAPNAGPRTKPKALAAALPFARGSFVVVYDAEDVPDPDQLRKALAAYHRGPKNLACLQARLAIDNVGDSWLTRHFAAEYAGLFDVFLPALADLKLPLPLGGTSNHFRTDVLRKVGGWDPYNVTEDADLGMRLARFGYLTGVIDSTTYEEAPARLGPWLRQRTRWCKGWIQTWLVHMRVPSALMRELGAKGFFAFQLLVGATVFAALVHPIFLALLAIDATHGELFKASETIGEALRQGLAVTTLMSGYLGSAALGLVGLRRRHLMSSSWVLLLIPVYWLLLSFAAWRGAIQLVFAPHLWEKTEHGIARTSRYGKIATRREFRATAANRPRPRPRFARD